MTALNPSVRMIKSKGLPNPNRYVQMMNNEFAANVVNEERAPLLKGKWRESLGLKPEAVIDLEIGTGNGVYFANYSNKNPNRNLLGIELKFKPLIQSIKRSLSMGNKNSWAVRYHAALVDDLFTANEISNVFIYFPDPWPKKKHFKNRLINEKFLSSLFEIQKPGSFLEIKTDHPGYFDWIMEKMSSSHYKITRESRDLHNSEWASENIQTHFEKLWTSKGLPTHMVRAVKETYQQG